VTEADLQGKNAQFMDAIIFAELCSQRSTVTFWSAHLRTPTDGNAPATDWAAEIGARSTSEGAAARPVGSHGPN